MTLHRYNRKDWLCAILITIFLIILGGATLSAGLPYWGDDSSAYISEGIAIADGNFKEQTIKNYIMHPSELSAEADPDGLVYVWGYPLMLSAVYRVVGFDRVDYSSIIYYKIPLLLSLSLLGGILYLFFRRRFSTGVSTVLAVTFCLGQHLIENLNILYSDIPFLMLSMLTLLLMEVIAEKVAVTEMEKQKCDVKILLLSVLYGAALWLTHETRLNGKTVCMVAALGHLIYLVKHRKSVSKQDLGIQILPYALMFVLIGISEYVLLSPATSNMSDVGRASADVILQNAKYYLHLILNYLNGLPRIDLKVTGYILMIACVIGIVKKGIRENLHLTLLLVGTLIVDALLPYTQGLRYLYNILPILILFTAYGLQFIWMMFCRMADVPGSFKTYIKLCAAVMILVLPIVDTVSIGINNQKHFGETKDSDVYSAEAVDMYRYIQENIPEDQVIAFGKPRSLYLNTEKMSIRPGYNGHTISEADYYLEYDTNYGEFTQEKEEAEATTKTVLYENRLYTLYRVNKD